MNVDNFTYNSYELYTTNMLQPLCELDATIDSVHSNLAFSPLHTSSPRRASVSDRSGKSSVSDSQTGADKSNHIELTKMSNLRLLTVNCCSIRENKSEFTAALDYIKPDIICGTESWLRGIKPGKDPDKDAIKSSEIFPTNLYIHRNDRGSRGGGVFTGVRKGPVATEQPELVTECEIEWTKVGLKNNKDLYLSSFYMPHRNMNDINNLNDSLKKLSNSKKSKHIILAGDFNCPDIYWENLVVKQGAADREIQQALVELSIEHGLTQIHNEPTRYGNMLDLVFTNNPSLVKSSYSVPGISDHAMVVTDLDIHPKFVTKKPRKIYIYSKADWDSINFETDKLSKDIITDYESGKNVEDLWTMFKTKTFEIMDKFIPTKILKGRRSVPWFSYKLRRMTRRKARLYKHAKKSKQWTEFKSFQRQCKKAFKEAEVNHINDVINEGLQNKNSKPFWRYVKSRKQDNIGISQLKKLGSLFSESKEKGQILVEQFRSVFTIEDSLDMPHMEKQYRHKLPDLTIKTEGVEKLLKNIVTSKACGPDNIPNIILKNCAVQLAPGLRTIFQLSVDSGTLPKDWLNANVSPVFKKGDVHMAENYRPLSLTSVSCKLLEHIICKHLLDH